MALDMSKYRRQTSCMDIVYWEKKARRQTVLTTKTTEYLQNVSEKPTDMIPNETELFNLSDSEMDGDVTVGGGHGSTKLGCWLATGICGNNITSSCLYVIALCAVPAGKYAPIALSFIAGLLYLFRGIYTEVVEALPVNGGTYNLLLNTTSKSKASIAACLTMLSYVTTAVISSTSGMSYIKTLVGESFDLQVWTIICLSFAAILNLLGITDSAVVALVIFLFHMVSITMLLVIGFYTAITNMPMVFLPGLALDPTALNATLTLPEPMSMLAYNWEYGAPSDGILLGTFFGYANALLGISGFESSSNYVEEQAPGVFPKTLRNMWIAVTIINPMTALLAQCLMPMKAIQAQAASGALLSELALKSGGDILRLIIVIDGATVLIGAVIVAFVGFNGLVHRMTLDRCLPQILLKTNPCRGTRHWIIIGFWFLTSLLVIYTKGAVDTMAGIYTMAFLTVMILFTIGNMLIKLKRSSLPTPLRVSYPIVCLAFVMMVLGLIGNLLSSDITSLQGFIMFGGAFLIPVQVMLNRVPLMRMLATAVRPCVSIDNRNSKTGCCVGFFKPFMGSWIQEKIHDPLVTRMIGLEQKPLIFFTSNDDPPILLGAIRYFRENESRKWYKFVRVFEDKSKFPTEIPSIYKALAKLFTDVQIDFVCTAGTFCPRMVQMISCKYKVPTNFMFMSSFGNNLGIGFMQLGGLRIITPNTKTDEETAAESSVIKRHSNRHIGDDDEDLPA